MLSGVIATATDKHPRALRLAISILVSPTKVLTALRASQPGLAYYARNFIPRPLVLRPNVFTSLPIPAACRCGASAKAVALHY